MLQFDEKVKRRRGKQSSGKNKQHNEQKQQQKEKKSGSRSSSKQKKNSKPKEKTKYSAYSDPKKLPYYNEQENYTQYPPCANPKDFNCNMQFINMKYQQVCCGRIHGPPQPTGTGEGSAASMFRTNTVHRDSLGRVVGVERG